MCHPKHNPLNGLPARIGNPAGIASRHGNCRGLSQPPAPISTKNRPRHFFLIPPRSGKICGVSFLQQSHVRRTEDRRWPEGRNAEQRAINRRQNRISKSIYKEH